jgi:hypothetical protein
VTTDLKDFYLGTPMERYEYMCLPVHMIPDSIMELYKLHDLVHHGHVYAEIRKGMYGFCLRLEKLPMIDSKHSLRLMDMLPPLVSLMGSGNITLDPLHLQ